MTIDTERITGFKAFLVQDCANKMSFEIVLLFFAAVQTQNCNRKAHG